MTGHVRKALHGFMRGEGGPLVQICVVALVFALFSSLFFVLAIMDLRHIEEMFLNLRMKRAQDIVRGMEQTVERKIRNLSRMSSSNLPLLPDREDASSVQDAFVRALIGVAENIDFKEQTGPLSREQLLATAQSESFAVIAILDESGEARVQTAPLPRFLLSRIEPLVDGREQASVRLFEDGGLAAPLGVVGIHSRQGNGAVIILLDAGGLARWRLVVSARKTAEELQWVRGILYLVLDDTSGHRIATAGDIPQNALPDPSPMEMTGTGAENMGRPKVRAISSNSIEIALPFQLHGKNIGIARVGLGSPADQLVTEERRHIFLWTGAMIVTGLIAMGIFYQAQNRHFLRMQAIRERLRQAERLSALGRLAAGVAHEIRNPLNAISMATQRIQKEFSPAESKSREEFDRITFIVRDEIKRLNTIVEDFLCFSRTDRLEFSTQPIAGVLGRVLFLVRDEANMKGIRIEECEVEPSPSILMDARRLEQALLNIVQNAMESITGEGTVRITTEIAEKDRVNIRVQDSGAGMRKDELNRIFDPFYTTKGNGTGLGLCIANEIVVAHGGEILVHSEPGRGTTVEIRLPLKTG